MDDSTSPQRIKRRLLIALQIILGIGALGFAFWQISKYTSSLNLLPVIERWPSLVFAGVMYVGFYGVLAMHWQVICRQIEENVSGRQWLAFFAAQPYKYLPSSIFTFTFRAKYAKELGLGYKKSSAAQLVENFSMLASAAILGFCSWLTLYSDLLVAILFFVLGVGSYVVCFEVLQKTKIKISLSVKKRLIILLLSGSAWLIAGVAFFITTRVLGDPVGLAGAIGSNAAAFGGGILAVFAPGGLGVREFIYGMFEIAAVVIVTWRLITALVDIIVGPLAWLAIKRQE